MSARERCLRMTSDGDMCSWWNKVQSTKLFQGNTMIKNQGVKYGKGNVSLGENNCHTSPIFPQWGSSLLWIGSAWCSMENKWPVWFNATCNMLWIERRMCCFFYAKQYLVAVVELEVSTFNWQITISTDAINTSLLQNYVTTFKIW